MLKAFGAVLRPLAFNYSSPAQHIMNVVLKVEAAAVFDHWQRSGEEDLNVRQDDWPPDLRAARMVPAVEYIQV